MSRSGRKLHMGYVYRVNHKDVKDRGDSADVLRYLSDMLYSDFLGKDREGNLYFYSKDFLEHRWVSGGGGGGIEVVSPDGEVYSVMGYKEFSFGGE